MRPNQSLKSQIQFPGTKLQQCRTLRVQPSKAILNSSVQFSGRKLQRHRKLKSPAKESDSDEEGSIDVENSSQGSKRSTGTPEKIPAQKKRKKNPPPVVLPQCELRPRTNKDARR